MNAPVIHQHTHIHVYPQKPTFAYGKERLSEVTGIPVKRIKDHLAEGSLVEHRHYEWDRKTMRFHVATVERDLLPEEIAVDMQEATA